MSFIPYKHGIQILDTTPIEDAGLNIQNNLIVIADLFDTSVQVNGPTTAGNVPVFNSEGKLVDSGTQPIIAGGCNKTYSFTVSGSGGGFVSGTYSATYNAGYGTQTWQHNSSPVSMDIYTTGDSWGLGYINANGDGVSWIVLKSDFPCPPTNAADWGGVDSNDFGVPITLTNVSTSGGTIGGNGGSGSDGASGVSGTSGTTGISGTSGTSGATGISGTSGTSGSGLSGTSGTSGTSGKSGTSGSIGLSGTSGTSGSGLSGTSGTTGSTGLSGTSGTSGSIGLSGTSGTSGSGLSGTSGTSGSTGISGTSGTSGKSGTSGTTGLSGTSGTSGSGLSGTSGTSGTKGISGTSGAAGGGGSGLTTVSVSLGNSVSDTSTFGFWTLTGALFPIIVSVSALKNTKTFLVNSGYNQNSATYFTILPIEQGQVTSDGDFDLCAANDGGSIIFLLRRTVTGATSATASVSMMPIGGSPTWTASSSTGTLTAPPLNVGKLVAGFATYTPSTNAITIDTNIVNHAMTTVTTGTLTVNVSGTPSAGQTLFVEIKNSLGSGTTLTPIFSSSFAYGTDITAARVLADGKIDIYAAKYSTLKSKYVITGVVGGY